MEYARIISTCCYLLFVVAISAETCDKSKCPGPLQYYVALNCTPEYLSPEDCCAYKYNCDHLNSRSAKKCYVNGREYEIGEKLKEEDANPCDIGCTCYPGYDGVATFNCAIVDCFHGPVTPGCYLRNSPANCCPGEEVCPESPEDRASCEVEGKIYKDGEAFSILSEPDKNCYCSPGYAGINEEPFCVKPKHPYCSPDFRHASEIINNCAPVYYSTQSPQTSCSVFSRCQNKRDQVIKKDPTSEPGPATTCKFGNFTLNYGDELNRATDYSSVCVKCVCEVGPLPTCQRLPDDECDITDHPPFDKVNDDQ